MSSELLPLLCLSVNAFPNLVSAKTRTLTLIEEKVVCSRFRAEVNVLQFAGGAFEAATFLLMELSTSYAQIKEQKYLKICLLMRSLILIFYQFVAKWTLNNTNKCLSTFCSFSSFKVEFNRLEMNLFQ
ncbi:hypothetical protein EGR_04900 [Echinococcus granulosus]|uniref:Uncharacterized protein n=1 Tax=Echinococcus granulosus TaxID=6210 RepID=W6UFI7_ECHGR|nr:hypothetical protein EGR_04900 [Echinococcus granulosus]EUB60190.1 hypothetical protein EGR_04900 [Echinococcus granulosus]